MLFYKIPNLPRAMMMCKNQYSRPSDPLSGERPETQNNNDDGRKTPVGCRPKFLRCLCQRFGGE